MAVNYICCPLNLCHCRARVQSEITKRECQLMVNRQPNGHGLTSTVAPVPGKYGLWMLILPSLTDLSSMEKVFNGPSSSRLGCTTFMGQFIFNRGPLAGQRRPASATLNASGPEYRPKDDNYLPEAVAKF